MNKAIDRAVEASRAADVDALVDGNGDAAWQVEDKDYEPVDRTPAASILAVALNDAFRAHTLKDVISAGYNGLTGRFEVHVTREYFEAHYKDDFESVEEPKYEFVQHIVDLGGTAVYCIEKAKFKMVRGVE